MDLLSVFRADNQRQYLTQLLPGMTALWPFLLLVLDGLGIVPDPKLEWNWLILVAIYLIASWGLGVLIEDMGTLLELRLEGVYFQLRAHQKGPYKSGHLDRNPLSPWTIFVSLIRHFTAPLFIIFFKGTWRWYLGCHLNEVIRPTKEIAKEEFYENWARYLEISFDSNREPIALRYYRAVLIRFKFGINMTLAIVVMLLGHLTLQFSRNELDIFLSLFTNRMTWLYLGICYATTSLLLVEAFKVIELLDEVRGRLVTIAKKNQLYSR